MLVSNMKFNPGRNLLSSSQGETSGRTDGQSWYFHDALVLFVLCKERLKVAGWHCSMPGLGTSAGPPSVQNVWLWRCCYSCSNFILQVEGATSPEQSFLDIMPGTSTLMARTRTRARTVAVFLLPWVCRMQWVPVSEWSSLNGKLGGVLHSF